MQKKDEKLMRDIIDFVNEFYRNNNKSPSIRTIAAGVDAGRDTVHRYLVAMDKRGDLEYDGKTIRTPQSELIIEHNSRNAGVVGAISCGFPSLAEENIEEYIPLPTRIFGDGDLYILRTFGDSMIEAGICEGDYVVIRKQDTANEGDIVVALVDGEETTLKRLFFDTKAQEVILHPENKRLHDIRVPQCEIQGVLVSVIKPAQNCEKSKYYSEGY